MLVSEPTVHNRRVKRAMIDGQTLCAMFSPTFREEGVIACFEGFPPDAKVVSVNCDYLHANAVVLHVESETFDEVGEGEMIPYLPITFHIHMLDKDGSIV